MLLPSDMITAADLQCVWDVSGLQGEAGVRLPGGEVWRSAPHEVRHRPQVIYSLTKTFIAVAILWAVDRGVLRLDDAISEYLPVALPCTVTIRRLLNHTAGIPDYGQLRHYHDAVRSRPGQPWTDAETLECVLAHSPESRPGERFAYSNSGYMLLRQFLDTAVSGGTRQALNESVIEPLGLADTRLMETRADLLGLSAGRTELLGDGISDVRGIYHPQWVKHYALASTVPDLLRFADVLAGEQVLSAERVREMLTGVDVPGPAPGFDRPGYGLGVMLDHRRAHGELIVGHAGGGPGYGAALFQRQRPNETPVTAIVVSRRDGSPAVQQTALDLLAAVDCTAETKRGPERPTHEFPHPARI